MKTSELIKKLTDVMSKDGDLEVEVREAYGSTTQTIENIYSSSEFYGSSLDSKHHTIIETDLMSG